MSLGWKSQLKASQLKSILGIEIVLVLANWLYVKYVKNILLSQAEVIQRNWYFKVFWDELVYSISNLTP